MAGAGVKVLCPNPKAKSLADLYGKVGFKSMPSILEEFLL